MLNKLIDKLKQLKLSISCKCVPAERVPLVEKESPDRVKGHLCRVKGPICRS